MISTSFEAIRLRFDSTQPFDALRTSLLGRMGTIAPGEIRSLVEAAHDAADFERQLRPFVGASGFILLAEINHGSWLPFYGMKRKATRLIFGNPAIAITMIKHDIALGLFAPVELLLFETGEGCAIIYDLPSALMQAHRTAELLHAAQGLDAKMNELVTQAIAD